MNRVIVGLGSNIDPEKNIQKAKEILAKKYHILAESCFEATKPIGEIPQDDFTVSESQSLFIPISKIDARSAYFINGAVLLETKLSLNQLKTALKDTESDLGREEMNDHYGPRTIDLDIIVWNKTIIDRDFHSRDYLKQSVLELIPDLKY